MEITKIKTMEKLIYINAIAGSQTRLSDSKIEEINGLLEQGYEVKGIFPQISGDQNAGYLVHVKLNGKLKNKSR